MHSVNLYPAGIGVEAESKEDGQYVKAEIVEPTAQRLVRKGVLRAFSVGISRPKIIRDRQARGGRVVDGVISEISIVDRPANANCKLALCKMSNDGSPSFLNRLEGDAFFIQKAAKDIDTSDVQEGVSDSAINAVVNGPTGKDETKEDIADVTGDDTSGDTLDPKPFEHKADKDRKKDDFGDPGDKGWSSNDKDPDGDGDDDTDPSKDPDHDGIAGAKKPTGEILIVEEPESGKSLTRRDLTKDGVLTEVPPQQAPAQALPTQQGAGLQQPQQPQPAATPTLTPEQLALAQAMADKQKTPNDMQVPQTNQPVPTGPPEGHVSCNTCDGTGAIPGPETRCPTCRGAGHVADHPQGAGPPPAPKAPPQEYGDQGQGGQAPMQKTTVPGEPVTATPLPGAPADAGAYTGNPRMQSLNLTGDANQVARDFNRGYIDQGHAAESAGDSLRGTPEEAATKWAKEITEKRLAAFNHLATTPAADLPLLVEADEVRLANGLEPLNLVKRDFDSGVGEHGTDRDKLPESDFAGPHRSFPIVSPSDVNDAWRLAGHANDPDAVRARIKEIAHRKGKEFVDALPDTATHKVEKGISSYEAKRLHDMTCPCYEWQDVVEEYPALAKTGLGPSLGGTGMDVVTRLLDAELARPQSDAFAVKELMHTSDVLERILSTDTSLLDDARAQLTKDFLVSNSNGKKPPKPSDPPMPGQFTRGFLTAGHYRENAQGGDKWPSDAGGPSSAQTPEASDFHRGYLSEGHEADSPANKEDSPEVAKNAVTDTMPSPGSSAMTVWSDAARNAVASNLLVIHDMTSGLYPQFCNFSGPTLPTASSGRHLNMGGEHPRSQPPYETRSLESKSADPTLTKMAAKELLADELAKYESEIATLKQQIEEYESSPSIAQAPYRGVVAVNRAVTKQDKTTEVVEPDVTAEIELLQRMAASGNPEARMRAETRLAKIQKVSA